MNMTTENELLTTKEHEVRESHPLLVADDEELTTEEYPRVFNGSSTLGGHRRFPR
jgi:hypothetical protein